MPHGHARAFTVVVRVTGVERFAESSTARTWTVSGPEPAGVKVWVQVVAPACQFAARHVVPSSDTSTPATLPDTSVTEPLIVTGVPTTGDESALMVTTGAAVSVLLA